jgi:hypothetical protein
MKTAKAGKDARSDSRTAKQRRRCRDRPSVHVLGGTMDPEVLERLLGAVGGLDLEAPWETIAPTILPVLKRVWHPYPPDAAPLHIRVPPGIPTGFGIDFGPAFSHVTPQLVERWGVDEATLLGTALENLRRLVEVEPPVVQRFAHDGVEVVAIQGQGWGSSLLLLPDMLGPIVGPEPHVLLAPVRNTVVALPDDVEADLALDIWEALAAGAHDELDVEPMRWTGSSVVGLADRRSKGLPN